MENKLTQEYFPPDATNFNYNNVITEHAELCSECFERISRTLCESETEPAAFSVHDINSCFCCHASLQQRRGRQRRSLVLQSGPVYNHIAATTNLQIPTNVRICYACWFRVHRYIQRNSALDTTNAIVSAGFESQAPVPVVSDHCILCSHSIFGLRTYLVPEGPERIIIASRIHPRQTGGADSASGGSGGSGMECLQIRSQPFHYLISEQAKSLVALQELQNEVGALLEFRDLVIETFPNLRSKMAPSTPAGGARRDWEPGVRVRRKLAAAAGEPRAKPQPSVQDSGFSTETSCGKDASASRSRPLEDELWALLDVIQRKGVRLREEAEMLRGELEDRHSQSQDTAEESFVRALSNGCGDCADLRRLRIERDALLAKNAQLEAEALISTPLAANTPLGRLDSALETPLRPPRLPTPDSKKFFAILQESNPLELQRQLLTSTVQNQLLHERLRRLSTQRSSLMERLERTKDSNEDLKFRLEEKSIELEGTRARLRQLEGKLRSSSNDSLDRSRDMHNSMRDMEPLHIPDGDEERISETPKRRPSRIPLHTSHKGTAPKPPSSHSGQPPRPPSAHSAHSVRSVASAKSRTSIPKPSPVRRTTPTQLDNKKVREEQEANGFMALRASSGASLGPSKQMADPRTLVTEYLARTERLAPLFPRLHTVRTRPLPADLMLQCKIAYETPQNLALELSKSILYENADSIDIKSLKSINSHCDSLWNGKPQRYFESMKFADDDDVKQYEVDSLTQ